MNYIHIQLHYELFVGFAKHNKYRMVFLCFLGSRTCMKFPQVRSFSHRFSYWQKVKQHEIPVNPHFPMVFPWVFPKSFYIFSPFSHGFPIVFPWFSYGFPHGFPHFWPPKARSPCPEPSGSTRSRGQVRCLADELAKYDTDFETAKIWVGKQAHGDSMGSGGWGGWVIKP